MDTDKRILQNCVYGFYKKKKSVYGGENKRKMERKEKREKRRVKVN